MKRPNLGMAPIKTEVSVEAYSEIMKLEKEIKRLRKALIAIYECYTLPDQNDAEMREIARVALRIKK